MRVAEDVTAAAAMVATDKVVEILFASRMVTNLGLLVSLFVEGDLLVSMIPSAK